jgi:F-type H+-transporting ATPase subunit delta
VALSGSAPRRYAEAIYDLAAAEGAIVDRRAGIVKAKIATAVALDDGQRRSFVERLERASGRKVKATFTVDEGLIGGARVQLGDHLVDSSVRAQLNELRQQLSS